jgi:transposase-like protein
MIRVTRVRLEEEAARISSLLGKHVSIEHEQRGVPESNTHVYRINVDGTSGEMWGDTRKIFRVLQGLVPKDLRSAGPRRPPKPKGRTPMSKGRKLTPTQRADIVEAARTGSSYKTIAAQFGVSESHVANLSLAAGIHRHKPPKRKTKAHVATARSGLNGTLPLQAEIQVVKRFLKRYIDRDPNGKVIREILGDFGVTL